MALGSLVSGIGRSLRDQAVVDACFPAATRQLAVDGVKGWLYPVESRLGEGYQLFAWFDGSAYQVKVVAPDVGRADPHACHLFRDGRICFGDADGGGMPSLEEAWAKSVLWANGFSVWRRGAPFPF